MEFKFRMMAEKIKIAIDKTNGYKTKAAALLYLLVSSLGSEIPFVTQNKEVIFNVLDLLIASGLLHDIWRNRKKIIDFVSNLFKKKT